MSTPILSALPQEQAEALVVLRNVLAEREPVIAAHNGTRLDLQDPELVALLEGFDEPDDERPCVEGASLRVASQQNANRR